MEVRYLENTDADCSQKLLLNALTECMNIGDLTMNNAYQF